MDRETEEMMRSIEKPVTMAGFTKKDFQRVNQTLLVLHENKVTYNYMKLLLKEAEDWLIRYNSQLITEDQLLEIMCKTIKLSEADSERFIESICDKKIQDAKKLKTRVVDYSYLKRFVDYYCYAPNTTRP